jgi:hypothetical protein
MNSTTSSLVRTQQTPCAALSRDLFLPERKKPTDLEKVADELSLVYSGGLLGFCFGAGMWAVGVGISMLIVWIG